jgi:hypothetical protein
MSDFSNKPIMLFNDLPWSRWPEVLPRTPDDEALPLKVGIYDDLWLSFLPITTPGKHSAGQWGSTPAASDIWMLWPVTVLCGTISTGTRLGLFPSWTATRPLLNSTAGQ